MRLTVLIMSACVVFFLIMLAGGCRGTQVKQHESPHIVFESTEYNLDTIPQKGEFEFSFKFSNNGTSTLEILSTKVSCGCTIIEDGAQVLQPGESSIITGKFYSKQYKGLLVRTIAVTTNDPVNERVVLYIKAIIEESPLSE